MKTILSAQYANASQTAVVLTTEEAGAVMIEIGPEQDVSGGWRDVYELWTGETSPFEEPAPDYIAEAESWIASFFSTARLLQMKVWWDTYPHEETPKLAACFLWADGVTRLAIGGSNEFQSPPYTFTEIATESLTQPTP